MGGGPYPVPAMSPWTGCRGLWPVARGSAIQQLRQRCVARLAATCGGTAVYTLLGLLLGLVRQATGGLLAATIAHGVLDVLMFAGMVVRRRQLRLRAVADRL